MPNSIVVLGAHGAKSKEGGSSSFLLNDTNVIDAGNLLIPLEGKSADIETVWLTHSHLDHIADLAYILDNYFEIRIKTLNIIALKETIEMLKEHFFNNKIWPDFSNIPLNNSKEMVVTYHPLTIGETYSIEEGKTLEAFYGDHSVPSVGYLIQESNRKLMLCADTYSLDHVVKRVKADSTITALVIECSFPIRLSHLAKTSKHLTASHLFDSIRPLQNMGLKLYINHIKPVYEEEIKEEIDTLKETWDIVILEDGDRIVF